MPTIDRSICECCSDECPTVETDCCPDDPIPSKLLLVSNEGNATLFYDGGSDLWYGELIILADGALPSDANRTACLLHVELRCLEGVWTLTLLGLSGGANTLSSTEAALADVCDPFELSFLFTDLTWSSSGAAAPPDLTITITADLNEPICAVCCDCWGGYSIRVPPIEICDGAFCAEVPGESDLYLYTRCDEYGGGIGPTCLKQLVFTHAGLTCTCEESLQFNLGAIFVWLAPTEDGKCKLIAGIAYDCDGTTSEVLGKWEKELEYCDLEGTQTLDLVYDNGRCDVPATIVLELELDGPGAPCEP
jgi:hypothetical protein